MLQLKTLYGITRCMQSTGVFSFVMVLLLTLHVDLQSGVSWADDGNWRM